MLYDEAKQRDLLEQLIEEVLRKLHKCLPAIGRKENLTEQNPQFAAIVRSANYLLRVFTSRFKSPGFAEENEWRLYAVMPSHVVTGVKFRDVKGMLTPYLELRLDVPAIEIESIYCGPTLHPELSVQSVSMLLAQYGLQDVAVHSSSIPFKL
jgi:hypothetical protein